MIMKLGNILIAREREITPCPFYTFTSLISNACGLSEQKCIATSEVFCLDCPKIKRLSRAFVNREYEVIKYFWLKLDDVIPNGVYWDNLVKKLTSHHWSTWQVRLGKYLFEKCRKEEKCPYKAMLPENLSNGGK